MKQTLLNTIGQFALVMATVSGLSACNNAADAVALVKGVAALAKGGKSAAQEAPPRAADFGFAPPAYNPAEQGDSAKNFKNQLEYTAAKKQTLYFDRDGKYADKPQPGGYYREIIGKTADGRTVAQDFYQDSGLLQTAPFAFAKNGDLNSFESDGNTDSRLVQFDRQGNLSAVMEYADGQPSAPMAMYSEGKLLAQMDAQLKVMAAYYEDGKTVAVVTEEIEEGLFRVTAFRPDGSAISKITAHEKRPDQAEEAHFWQADGSKHAASDKEQIFAEADAAKARADRVVKRSKELE